MIKKSENREKKMQKLLGKALFEVLFLQIVIYLTGRNAGKDFLRTEGTVFFMITMLVILNALKLYDIKEIRIKKATPGDKGCFF